MLGTVPGLSPGVAPGWFLSLSSRLKRTPAPRGARGRPLPSGRYERVAVVGLLAIRRTLALVNPASSTRRNSGIRSPQSIVFAMILPSLPNPKHGGPGVAERRMLSGVRSAVLASLTLALAAWVLLGLSPGAAQAREQAGLTQPALTALSAGDSPGLTITMDPPSAPENQLVALQASVSDTTGGSVLQVTFEISLSGPGQWGGFVGVPSGNSGYSYEVDTSHFQPGSYDVRAIAWDSVGDSTISAVQTLVITSQEGAPPPSPTVIITNAPLNLTISTRTTSPTVSYAEGGDVTSTQCTLSPQPGAIPCSASEAQLTGLSLGSYTFTVEVLGPSGERTATARFGIFYPEPVVTARAYRVGPIGQKERWELDGSASDAAPFVHITLPAWLDPAGKSISRKATAIVTLAPGRSYIFHFFVSDDFHTGGDFILTVRVPPLAHLRRRATRTLHG
jgi:hypothetical protein